MRIGITGATGMIGRAVVLRLAELQTDISLRCLARSVPSDRLSNKVEWLQGDLMSEGDCCDFVGGLDGVIHLAQANSPVTSDRHWPSDLFANLGGTLNLLEAIRKHSSNACRFLYASSGGAVYGSSVVAGRLVRETDSCCPVSPYGIQKLAAENYIRLGAAQGWLQASVLRIGNAYGSLLPSERKQGFIGVALSRIKENLPVVVFGSENTIRDFVHTDDVASAFVAALGRDESFEVYNIGSGVGTSIREVIQLLSKVVGRGVQLTRNQFGAQVFGLMPEVVLSGEKAFKMLGWRPRIDLDQGIRELWERVERS